jgi:microcystin-dependent protein
MDVYIGAIFGFGFNWAPDSFLTCAGQTLTVTQYQALYSLLGSIYGSTQQSNFMLPNLTGRVPVGFSTTNANYQMAHSAGLEMVTLTTNNVPLASHIHPATFAPTTGQVPVTIPATAGSLQVAPTLNAVTIQGGDNAPVKNCQLGTGGSGGAAANIYVDPSKISPTTPTVSLGGLSATVTGTAPTASVTTNITALTGGNVAVAQNTPTTPTLPVSLMQPYLAINFVMAVNGIYPTRP